MPSARTLAISRCRVSWVVEAIAQQVVRRYAKAEGDAQEHVERRLFLPGLDLTDETLRAAAERNDGCELRLSQARLLTQAAHLGAKTLNHLPPLDNWRRSQYPVLE